jgi:hypothetical protein
MQHAAAAAAAAAVVALLWAAAAAATAAASVSVESPQSCFRCRASELLSKYLPAAVLADPSRLAAVFSAEIVDHSRLTWQAIMPQAALKALHGGYRR